MASKKEKKDNTGAALAAVWGSPLPSTQGAGRPGRGVRVFRKGTHEVIQARVDALVKQVGDTTPPAVPDVSSETDTRSPKQRQYDVRDGVAHVSIEGFYDLTKGGRNQLEAELGYTSVEISGDNGLSATYYPGAYRGSKRVEYSSDFPEMRKNGLSSILRSGGGVTTLKNPASMGAGVAGYIICHTLPHSLAAHASTNIPTSQINLTRQREPIPGNFRLVFNSKTAVKNALRGRDTPLGITVSAKVGDEDPSPVQIGKLHKEKPKKIKKSDVLFQTITELLRSGVSTSNPIASIFGRYAAVAIVDGAGVGAAAAGIPEKDRKVLAYLVRRKDGTRSNPSAPPAPQG